MYLGIHEYDKIVPMDDIREVLMNLMDIKKPTDDIGRLTDDNWLNIQYAIKMLMDAYGIHINHENGCLVKDGYDITDELPHMWWLEKFKTKYDKEKHQMITIEK